MALRHVKDVIQSEVIAALTTIEDLVAVVAASNLTATESLAADQIPCAVVMMPECAGFRPVNSGTASATYTCAIDLFTAYVDLTLANAENAELIHSMILALEARYTTALINCGLHDGAVQVSDQGWGNNLGQELIYRITATFPLYPPTSQLVEDGIEEEEPEEDPEP